ncbi:hypothetical protein C7449_108113 [Mycoplana dimorpha]|uniref:Uncharacterized protein n=1 Tax=Mycoplana dimorpha TaxID=28320 RepID=A0A2T5AZC9_MYCDI|nr:hypothetical protein C7449_108113 [Mycoplana dimorpha]
MGRFLKALPCAHSTGDFEKHEEFVYGRRGRLPI